MTLEQRTSRIFAAVRAVRAELDAVAWPSYPSTDIIPETRASIIESDHPSEWIAVVTDVGEDATVEWVTLGAQGRDETFTIRILVHTAMTGASDLEVEDRLEELCDLVQGCFVETHPSIPGRLTFKPPPFDGVMAMGGISQVAFGIWPEEEKFSGQAEIQLRVHARI
jgi:hypothetical protein